MQEDPGAIFFWCQECIDDALRYLLLFDTAKKFSALEEKIEHLEKRIKELLEERKEENNGN